MSLLSDNLTSRRLARGMLVKEVHAELNRRGVPVAYSTVAGWFNGNRGIEDMQHLRKLCDVLQTDIDSITMGQIELSEEPLDVTISRESKSLPEDKKQVVLALIKSLKS